MTEENTAPATDEQASPDCANRTYVAADDSSSCCADRTHDGDPEPKDSPTREEIDAAWEHLQSLIARADFHAVAFAAFAGVKGNQVTSVCSNSLLLPHDTNLPGPSLLWIATLGGLDLARKSLQGCKQSVKDGLDQYLDARWEKKQATDLYTIISGIVSAKSPDEEQGEQTSTEG